MLEKKLYSVNMEESKDIIDECVERLKDYSYICDGISEIVDSNIDIYNYSLRQWAVNNYDYIEEAMELGLCEGMTNFHKLIQMGQYEGYTQEIYENEKEIYYNILIELLEEETEEEILTFYEAKLLEAIEEIAEEIDHNDNGSIFEEKINELLEEKREEYEESMEE